MKNNYEIRGEITVIFLLNKKGEIFETLIDTEDLEKVKEENLSWHLKWDKALERYYCKATRYLGMIDGKPKYQTVHLHTLILNAKNQHVDHINSNTLDNRKSNLRDVSAQRNLLNRKGGNKNSATGIRNVTYCKVTNKYIVQLQINRKNTRMGTFNDLNEATIFAEKMREKYYPKQNK